MLHFEPGRPTDRVVTLATDDSLDPVAATILLDGSSNTVTATLPSAVGRKSLSIAIKCVDATFQCDIATNGSEEVDESSANIVLGLYETKTVQSDGSNWWLI